MPDFKACFGTYRLYTVLIMFYVAQAINHVYRLGASGNNGARVRGCKLLTEFGFERAENGLQLRSANRAL
jgi:hypothetical protein